jgi:hypothetical protein
MMRDLQEWQGSPARDIRMSSLLLDSINSASAERVVIAAPSGYGAMT